MTVWNVFLYAYGLQFYQRLLGYTGKIIDASDLIFQYMFRGAMSDQDKETLNAGGAMILRQNGFNFGEEKDYYWIRKETHDAGYAEYYLRRCKSSTTPFPEPFFHNGVSFFDPEPDIDDYKKLVLIDSALGTDNSSQLFGCICWAPRLDFIKVKKFLLIKVFKLS